MGQTAPSRTESPALVLLVEGAGGLWDRQGLALVGALEDRLPCFVTFATGNVAPPTLADALSACRFMGCREAVVVDARRPSVVEPVVLADEIIAIREAIALPEVVEAAYAEGCAPARIVAV